MQTIELKQNCRVGFKEGSKQAGWSLEGEGKQSSEFCQET